jgi:hydrogenase maturation protease
VSLTRHERRIVILGLGNVLVGDDALGPWVVRLLESRYELDPCISLVDGTPGNDLVPHLLDTYAVIVVDTVKSQGPPGEIRQYRREALLRKAPPARINPHQPGLQEALLTLSLMDAAPEEVLLVGVIPESVETRVGLTATVRGAVDRALDQVVRELGRLGAAPRARAMPLRPALWWESAAVLDGCMSAALQEA